MLGGLAEFERDLIRTRTGEGRARAVARGQRMGRPPKLTPHQQKEECPHVCARTREGTARRASGPTARRRYGYRVAVDCSGAAQTWRESPDLRTRLTAAASKATIPVFFLQAENDYDLTPNRILSEEVGKAGKSMETKTYPAFGSGAQEGHSFCWRPKGGD